MKPIKTPLQKIAFSFLLLWLTAVIWLTLLFEKYTVSYYRCNLIPFFNLFEFINCLSSKQLITSFYLLRNMIGNVFLFLPFGFLFPLVQKNNRMITTIMIALSLSLLIELIQLVTRLSVFDVDDLLMNSFGAALGYKMFEFVYQRSVFH